MKNSTILFFVSLVTIVGCSKTDTNSFYSNCVEIGMVEQMQGWDESDRPSVKVGVEQGCKMAVDECNKNPESNICASLKQKFALDQ